MIVKKDTPLNVPFKEKDAAKAIGARWNPAKKYWYIPEGIDDEPFAKWHDAPQPTDNETPQLEATAKTSNVELDDDDHINALLREAYDPEDDE